MQRLAVGDINILVAPDSGSRGGKGGLFERFIAHLLEGEFGFESPSTKNLNVTSDGIELDVRAHHKLTNSIALAECKAYSRPVAASELTNFYGKLTVERFNCASTFGMFCAIPRLTADGVEKAGEISKNDPDFKYLSANDLADALVRAGLVPKLPTEITHYSDCSIAITEHGLYGTCIELDSSTRTPTRVCVWGSETIVPKAAIDAIQGSAYADGLVVEPFGNIPSFSRHIAGGSASNDDLTPTLVKGSSSDFEYQLPASPRYFVGRKLIVEELSTVLETRSGRIVVLNAQSGWGKSSIALKMSDLTISRDGVALVLDTRTANSTRYPISVVRAAAKIAEDAGILDLPQDCSWASLDSAIRSLVKADWKSQSRPILIFFDQFENIFQDPPITRVFRDFALAARSIPGPLIVGFAWKTDLVGWTEGHPFQLRDDIRGAGTVIVVEPFGPREVDTILNRLSKEAGTRLVPDLRTRLRAYSQGLPWLLKKLADHVLRELKRGETQDGLLAESLNVATLFEADLAELSPNEQSVLKNIARFAPIAADEVTERFGPESIQSLVDRRLVVQVGDRLDTYWDTFRDYLNTGVVPVQESWILRHTPRGVARLLPVVVESGGSATVQDLCSKLSTSDNAIFNLSRELRLLGVAMYESNRVTIIPEVMAANDPEAEMRRRVAHSLRRHRAFTTLRDLAERSGGQATIDSYSRELPFAFPAVEVSESSWKSYARAFLFWMEYAGLAARHGSDYSPLLDSSPAPTMRLLDPRSPIKYRPNVPFIGPGRALYVLSEIVREGGITIPPTAKDREATGSLAAIGAVSVSPDGFVTLTSPHVMNKNAEMLPHVLKDLLLQVPGGSEGISLLTSDPGAHPATVGAAIRAAAHATWAEETTRGIGGHFRSWARLAGLNIVRPPRKSKQKSDQLAFEGMDE